MIEVFVSGLAFDTLSKAPVILLREIDGSRILPIWIGPNEAAVIALELSGVSYKRPLTHDLMKSVLNGFNAKLQKIVVSSLKDNTYYAKFYIQADEISIIEIDARPSDSVAMALKMKAPIFISDELNNSLIDFIPPSDDEPSEDDSFTDPMDLKSRLRNIKPEDFGNYNL
ncbi:MAG TPA: bifunctional nuclease family protein [bacterium]|nr:bifunctional nuclease family protein [bacterium]